MDILSKIDGLEAKFHEVSLLITDPAVIADQARYVRLNREYHDLERVLAVARKYKQALPRHRLLNTWKRNRPSR